MNPRRLAPLFALCILTTVVDARADVKEATHHDAGDYYSFTDDPLHSDVMDGSAPRIIVRGTWLRAGLLRPRASFVVEMLKSVEAI